MKIYLYDKNKKECLMHFIKLESVVLNERLLELQNVRVFSSLLTSTSLRFYNVIAVDSLFLFCINRYLLQYDFFDTASP
jgi:hypothetical protein